MIDRQYFFFINMGPLTLLRTEPFNDNPTLRTLTLEIIQVNSDGY